MSTSRETPCIITHPYFILPIYRSAVKHYTIPAASLSRSRHFRLKFLYIRVLSYFNNFNLYLIFLTLPIHNLTKYKFKLQARSQLIPDNFIQFYIAINSFILSFYSLSYDKSKASSKATSPHSAI